MIAEDDDGAEDCGQGGASGIARRIARRRIARRELSRRIARSTGADPLADFGQLRPVVAERDAERGGHEDEREGEDNRVVRDAFEAAPVSTHRWRAAASCRARARWCTPSARSSAVSPSAKNTIAFDIVPPGDAAGVISVSATCGARSNARATACPPAGIGGHCDARPTPRKPRWCRAFLASTVTVHAIDITQQVIAFDRIRDPSAPVRDVGRRVAGSDAGGAASDSARPRATAPRRRGRRRRARTAFRRARPDGEAHFAVTACHETLSVTHPEDGGSKALRSRHQAAREIPTHFPTRAQSTTAAEITAMSRNFGRYSTRFHCYRNSS